MPSLSRQPSPAPTYTSTRAWPLQDKSSDQKTSLSDPITKPDHLDPHHPHYISAPSPSSSHLTETRRRRWPRKHILIPYTLALLFFLTTLWFTSIALGVRLFNVLKENDRDGLGQEVVNVYVNGIERGGIVETVTMTASMGSVASSTDVATSTSTLQTTSTYTGRLHLVQTGAPDIGNGNVRRRETGFVTVVRRV
jgi:hypothetical protein